MLESTVFQFTCYPTVQREAIMGTEANCVQEIYLFFVSGRRS